VEDLPFILKKPTTNGAYTFLYWYVSGSSDTPVFTIPEGSTGEKTFYAKWHQNGQSLTSAADIGAYLVYADGGDSAADPITLPPVHITLADGTNGWTALLTAISGANKFVALDLSACGMDGMTTTEGEFDPKPAITTGKNKIVSLVLPDAATSIRGGTSGNPTFKGFSVQSVTGNKVETIGGYAFSGNSGLTTLNLPSAISIDRYAFNNTGTKTLTITLGSTAPTLGGWLFNGAGAKTVNVRVPTAASSKYNTTWINDLKYGNTSMIVNIETY
jgi:uncharacterized repeat protein (TIGR02543 family)